MNAFQKLDLQGLEEKIDFPFPAKIICLNIVIFMKSRNAEEEVQGKGFV